jgi:hypothetical protein
MPNRKNGVIETLLNLKYPLMWFLLIIGCNIITMTYAWLRIITMVIVLYVFSATATTIKNNVIKKIEMHVKAFLAYGTQHSKSTDFRSCVI